MLVKTKVAQIKPTEKVPTSVSGYINYLQHLFLYIWVPILNQSKCVGGGEGAKQQVYLGRGEISASELQAEERKAAAFPLNLVNKKYIHTLIYSFIFKLKHKSVD